MGQTPSQTQTQVGKDSQRSYNENSKLGQKRYVSFSGERPSKEKADAETLEDKLRSGSEESYEALTGQKSAERDASNDQKSELQQKRKTKTQIGSKESTTLFKRDQILDSATISGG